MIFERLDRPLGHVPAVTVGGCELVGHVVLLNALLEIVGALIV